MACPVNSTMRSVVLLALLPAVTRKPIVTAPSPVWNHANATETICSVVGSVCHIVSVVVATKVPTIFPKRTSGTTNGVMRNVSASQTPRQLSVLRVTARMVKCASF